MRLTDAHQFDDSEGNWIRVLNFDFRAHGPLPGHFIAALWRWQAARNTRGMPALDAFGRDLSGLAGAEGKWHLFNIQAPQSGGFFLEAWSDVDDVFRNHDFERLPLSRWPFRAQFRAQGLSLTSLRNSGEPQLSVITRLYQGRPRTYQRLLCPLSEDGRTISHAASLVEPDGPPLALSLS